LYNIVTSRNAELTEITHNLPHTGTVAPGTTTQFTINLADLQNTKNYEQYLAYSVASTLCALDGCLSGYLNSNFGLLTLAKLLPLMNDNGYKEENHDTESIKHHKTEIRNLTSEIKTKINLKDRKWHDLWTFSNLRNSFTHLQGKSDKYAEEPKHGSFRGVDGGFVLFSATDLQSYYDLIVEFVNVIDEVADKVKRVQQNKKDLAKLLKK
jgi:hypothetical protein